jgi:hypothetical protein
MIVMAVAPLVVLSAISPVIAGAPVTIDAFQGGITNSTLVFNDTLINASLVLEIPRGANVTDATVIIEGVPADSIPGGSRYDFESERYGSDLWVKKTGNLDIYPPVFDPYAVAWGSPDNKEIAAIKKSDDQHWHTQTSGESLPPPLEWPVQLYHFRPPYPATTDITVTWEGYSRCRANQTNEYHCEMWLRDQRANKWVEVANYSSGNAGDVFLNHTFNGTSRFVHNNGSIDVALLGIHAEGIINPPVVINDYGHIYTDYMGLLATGSTKDYPRNMTLTIGGTEVFNEVGPFDRRAVIGGANDLASAIQSVIDSSGVAPGNVSIPFVFSIGSRTLGKLNVSELSVEYEPYENSPPAWTGPLTVTIEEDSSWNRVATLEDRIIDDHEPWGLTFEVVSVSDGANLSTRIIEDVVYNNHLEVRPASDFFGQVEVVVRAKDPFDATSDSPPITIIVNQTADRPVLTHPGEKHVLEGSILDLTIVAEDPDLPDDVLTFTDTSDWLDIEPATGRIVFTPNETQVGEHTFGVTVTDRFGLDSVILLTIVVENVNNAPVIVSALFIEEVQGEPVAYRILAEDADIPHGDAIIYFAHSSSLDVTCDPSSGLITFTPTNDQVPSFIVTLKVQDTALEIDEVELVVSVQNVNDPPFLQDLAPEDVYQCETVSRSLVFDDMDLHVDLAVPESLSITYEGPEAFAADPEGLISFTPDQALVGTHTVTYTVTDSEGLSASITVTWNVLDVNDPPGIVSDVPASVDAPEDEGFTLTLEAVDVDGDLVRWTDDSDLFEIDLESGTIAFTPTQADVGFHVVTVTASDGRGGMSAVSFDLVVVNVNDVPVIGSVLPVDGSEYDEGQTVGFEACATDEDGDALTFSWLSDGNEFGTGAALDYADLSPGAHTIKLVVSDGTASAEHELTVNIIEEEGDASSPPVLLLLAIILAVLGIVVALFLIRRRGETTAEEEGEP